MPKPATLNYVPDDPTGNTWALPEGAITRIGKGYHSLSASCEIALSPDKTYFAVGNRIGLWWYDVASMTPISLWEAERGMISIVEISTNGKLIAFANWDGFIKVRDIQGGECIAEINRKLIHTVNKHLTFSPGSCRIAIVNRDKYVEVFDVQNGECLVQIEPTVNEGEKNSISKLQFSPNEQHLAATVRYQTYLWDPITGSMTAEFSGRNFALSRQSVVGV